MPETRKCEGKLNSVLSSSGPAVESLRFAGAILFGEVWGRFIRAAKSFSEMFTTYSHSLPLCPASGLETRNRR